jgi:uncharacterized Zn finger protein
MNNQQWWVQRWLELLDSYRFKKRLERARNYARGGNVLSIDFYGAEVLAKVQGSEAEPYQVSLFIEPFTDEDWDYVINTLSEKAIFSAQLLAGKMPDDIEQVFISNGLNLFPFSLSDIRSRCTCPDKANPCKHIGAVYYQLGDRFSEDPFVIFQLRGRNKEQILEALRQKRGQKKGSEILDKNGINLKSNKNRNLLNSSVNLARFWHYDEPLESSLVVVVPPTEGKTILDLLGKIPLPYADAEALEQYLREVYQNVSQQAMMEALQRDN